MLSVEYIAVLDLGMSRVRLLVYAPDLQQSEVNLYWTDVPVPRSVILNATYSNLSWFSQSVQRLITLAQKELGITIERLFCAYNGSQIYTEQIKVSAPVQSLMDSKGKGRAFTMVRDEEIEKLHERASEAFETRMASKEFRKDYHVLHMEPVHYLINDPVHGQRLISPIGHRAHQLHAVYNVFWVKRADLEQLISFLPAEMQDQAQIELGIRALVFANGQKNGVYLNMGYSHVEVAIVRDSRIAYYNQLPVCIQPNGEPYDYDPDRMFTSGERLTLSMAYGAAGTGEEETVHQNRETISDPKWETLERIKCETIPQDSALSLDQLYDGIHTEEDDGVSVCYELKFKRRPTEVDPKMWHYSENLYSAEFLLVASFFDLLRKDRVLHDAPSEIFLAGGGTLAQGLPSLLLKGAEAEHLPFKKVTFIDIPDDVELMRMGQSPDRREMYHTLAEAIGLIQLERDRRRTKESEPSIAIIETEADRREAERQQAAAEAERQRQAQAEREAEERRNRTLSDKAHDMIKGPSWLKRVVSKVKSGAALFTAVENPEEEDE